ncbi:hypothetical protein OAX78_03865 [Planctomycetota bacterium]|nr:hypothetical protein [Planctomycetota bacterium]
MSRFKTRLKRVRFELDLSARGIPFVGRAVRGTLSIREYRDLLAQLEFVCRALSTRGEDDPATWIALCLRQDQAQLEPVLSLAPAEPCMTVEWFSDAVHARRWSALGPGAQATALLVLGTSWLSDARCALGERAFPDAVSGLTALGRASHVALDQMLSSSESPGTSLGKQRIHSLTELTRGAVLGVVGYLDDLWPAPQLTINIPNG